MQANFYLVFDRHGAKRMRKDRPALAPGEYAVRMNVTVPDAFFDRPIPVAKVEVSADAHLQPVTVTMGDAVTVAPPAEVA